MEITDVAVRQGADRADIARILPEVERLCAPCGRELAGKKLMELRALTITRAKDDLDNAAVGAAYSARLAEFPADVVVAACDAWANREEFWPSWAELRAECDKRMRGRKAIVAALHKAMA